MKVHLHTHVYLPVRVGSFAHPDAAFFMPAKEPYEPAYPSEFQESHIGRAA